MQTLSKSLVENFEKQKKITKVRRYLVFGIYKLKKYDRTKWSWKGNKSDKAFDSQTIQKGLFVICESLSCFMKKQGE